MKALLPTACIRNSGFIAKSKVSAFNKSHCQTESEVFFNPLLLIHANRCPQLLIALKNSSVNILMKKLSILNLKIYAN